MAIYGWFNVVGTTSSNTDTNANTDAHVNTNIGPDENSDR